VPIGPREALEIVSLDIAQELRSGSTDIVDDGSGGFFLAGASAGRDVVFSPGEPSEVVIDASGRNGFRAIFAHYDSSGALATAMPLSEYAGGPLAGGTAQAKAVARESSGTVLIAGSFSASVRFGTTTWTTPQSDAGGAVTTSFETFVLRVDPVSGTIAALVRATSSVAGDSNGATSVVVHDSGEFTVAGYYQNRVTFEDGETLTESFVSNAGYVARFGANGTRIWSLPVPGYPYAEPLGSESVVVRFGYNAEFDLDDTVHSAPSDGHRGHAVARIDADGTVAWVLRVEGEAQPTTHAPVLGPNGRLYAGARLDGSTFPDSDAPTLGDGPNHVLEIDPDSGAIVGTFSSDLQGTHLEAMHLAFDDAGLLWCYTVFAPATEITLTPTFGDHVVVPSDDIDRDDDLSDVMVAWDVSDGSLAYAALAARGGGGSPSVMLRLESGDILVADQFYFEHTVDPLGDDPTVLTNNADGSDPDTVLIRYR
jgi:hypothetical protein